MAKLWKNMWESMCGNMWEICEKFSTKFRKTQEMVGCTQNLHKFSMGVYTCFSGILPLSIWRFCTVSTDPITTTNIYNKGKDF